jgi:rare lipoprotein A
MHCFVRTSLVSAAALVVSAPAFADPAPIVFAGQGGTSPATTQSASYEASGLAGGDERSYGYGRQARPRQGAVIDIRRATTPAPQAQVTAPLVLSRAQQPTPAETSPPPASERPQWLEEERVGPPYQANGRLYVPTPEPGYEQTGTASWYGPQFHGQRTASGEVFDQEALTAAHPTLPLNGLLQVTNLANGREVIVRVNDRGPFVGERLIDLSHGAAQALDFVREGRAQVHVRYLGPAPRRVNATGAPAPAPQVEEAEEGPRSLLPPASPAPVEETQLASASAPAPYSTPAPASTGAYFVQIGAFSDLTNAHNARDAVQSAGPVVVDTRQTAAGELFRVRVGPWGSREEAEAARRSVATLGYSEAVLASR